MLYILDQRLRAQAIEPDKAGKVRDDIVATMFNQRFVQEIFSKQQPVHSRRVRNGGEGKREGRVT